MYNQDKGDYKSPQEKRKSSISLLLRKSRGISSVFNQNKSSRLFGRVLGHCILLFVNNNDYSNVQSTHQDPSTYTDTSRHPTTSPRRLNPTPESVQSSSRPRSDQISTGMSRGAQNKSRGNFSREKTKEVGPL